jgi:hypothetical protein
MKLLVSDFEPITHELFLHIRHKRQLYFLLSGLTGLLPGRYWPVIISAHNRSGKAQYHKIVPAPAGFDIAVKSHVRYTQALGKWAKIMKKYKIYGTAGRFCASL